MSNEIYTVDVDADGIALVTWDMTDKSMNVFTQEPSMDNLTRWSTSFVADDAVKGVVFTSGKKDLFRRRRSDDDENHAGRHGRGKAQQPGKSQQMLFDQVGKMSWLYRKIETCGKPWVSAINGVCMGGAFELSLACHGRVAADSPSVKMALPEVKVGIFPGAGGTQRVPRLTNAQDALQMMTTGQSLTPSRAKAMGLIHEVVSRRS
jgi:3-hydroxyacyl-CoA dehydrogenase/enoyl-CoA hydratase/3-hydroxybutyryl-CoA epimerase